MTHYREFFRTVVTLLNQRFRGHMVFALAGSLAQKPVSQHDADIIVYPVYPWCRIPLRDLAAGFRSAEIAAVDRTSTEPFPGRPGGQDRVQVRWPFGIIVDFFFPKGVLVP